IAGSTSTAQSRRAWALAKRQHGVLARWQLLALGFTRHAIAHRLRTGRLRAVRRGVYAVGNLPLSRGGEWMGAVLTCGEGAFLTHRSAGALYGICEERPGRIEVGVRGRGVREPEGIRLRRRPSLPTQEVGTLHRIPVTSPVQTMIDLATEQGPKTLLRTVNEADKLEVIAADELREALEERAGQAGVRPLRALLDRETFVLSDEELERLFLPMALGVGLSLPQTKIWLNGYEVDFFWPELKLVVETDGLRYHRTPFAQARDARRDQAHTAAGFSRLRFTHHQVKYEADYVRAILESTRHRLGP
ncbi:MAG: DUF559 domain-containing protein, partial [Solirubrobacterales bacterium]